MGFDIPLDKLSPDSGLSATGGLSHVQPRTGRGWESRVLFGFWCENHNAENLHKILYLLQRRTYREQKGKKGQGRD